MAGQITTAQIRIAAAVGVVVTQLVEFLVTAEIVQVLTSRNAINGVMNTKNLPAKLALRAKEGVLVTSVQSAIAIVGAKLFQVLRVIVLEDPHALLDYSAMAAAIV